MAALMNNDIFIEVWNTVLFEKFLRFMHLLVEGLSSHSDAFLSRNLHPEGFRVLDIGCGFGDSTMQLAGNLGPSGEAVGVDCTANFIREAEADASHKGVENTGFMVADVERDDLQGPYDDAFARFGTMFFNLPGAAMNNINKSLKPCGRQDMIVWRKWEDNPWLHDAELRVKEIVPVVSDEETDQVHCGPGPFSMSGPDMVSEILKSTNFHQITFERHDSDICIGRTIEESVYFAMALGPAGETIRLAGEEGERLQGEERSALNETLSQFVRDDGVWGRLRHGLFQPASLSLAHLAWEGVLFRT